MIQGQVIGEVWATKKVEHLEGAKLLLVAQRDSSGAFNGRVIVARDVLDAKVGDEVVVSFGSGARNVLKPGSRDVLVDAAISQIIDKRPLF